MKPGSVIEYEVELIKIDDQEETNKVLMMIFKIQGVNSLPIPFPSRKF